LVEWITDRVIPDALTDVVPDEDVLGAIVGAFDATPAA
jgi:hypothetical protein